MELFLSACRFGIIIKVIETRHKHVLGRLTGCQCIAVPNRDKQTLTLPQTPTYKLVLSKSPHKNVIGMCEEAGAETWRKCKFHTKKAGIRYGIEHTVTAQRDA